MCNLYSMTRNVGAIRRLLRIPHNRAPASMEPLAAIFPSHMAPVVRRTEDGERELSMLSWGFVLLQNGKAPRRVTNVRDDKVLTSRFWRDSFEQCRCLVPASSFCEPNDGRQPGTPATWHWFANVFRLGRAVHRTNNRAVSIAISRSAVSKPAD